MEFKVFKNENSKILKEYWLTQSEWDALDKTTVQEGDIYHIVGTIDKGDLSADVNVSLAKGDSSLQKPTATLAKESFVKVGIDGTQKFDESSYATLDAGKSNVFNSANTFNQPVKFAKGTSYVEYGEQSSYKFRDNSKENLVATLNDLIEDDTKTYITFKGINFPGNNSFQVDKGAVIDWGDGTIQTVTGDPYETVSHAYSRENLYRIVISNLLSISNGAFSDCLGLLDFKLGSTVTNIGGAAFKGTSLSSVTIPKTITQMELLSIFAQCTNLKTVRVLSETPLTVQPEIFENSPIEKIIVPKSAINAYKSASGWSTYADKIVYEVDSSDLSVVKLYRHNLTCSDINNSQEVDISTYSTKQGKFTVDYIKANPTCLNGSISTVVNEDGQESFDRRIFRIEVDNIPPAADFVIESAGITPASRKLKLTSDNVIEL